MTAEDLEENLGTIAHSGSQEFKRENAETTFVKAMNERAKKLGCTGTLFENPHEMCIRDSPRHRRG